MHRHTVQPWSIDHSATTVHICWCRPIHPLPRLTACSVTGIFGGEPKPPAGGNPDSNTLISDMTTVICLDDYHSLDRNGRKEAGVTALDPKAQHFDLMHEQVQPLPLPAPALFGLGCTSGWNSRCCPYHCAAAGWTAHWSLALDNMPPPPLCLQVKALKEGKPVQKPIYNHVSGLLDPPEEIKAPKILIVEGLHPFFDDRVNELMDFRIYLDISGGLGRVERCMRVVVWRSLACPLTAPPQPLDMPRIVLTRCPSLLSPCADETKFAWKIQRDMAERGHSLESIKVSGSGLVVAWLWLTWWSEGAAGG